MQNQNFEDDPTLNYFENNNDYDDIDVYVDDYLDDDGVNYDRNQEVITIFTQQHQTQNDNFVDSYPPNDLTTHQLLQDNLIISENNHYCDHGCDVDVGGNCERESEKGFYKKQQKNYSTQERQQFKEDNTKSQLYYSVQIQSDDRTYYFFQTHAQTQRQTNNEEIGPHDFYIGSVIVGDLPGTGDNQQKESQDVSSDRTLENDDNSYDQQIDNGSQNETQDILIFLVENNDNDNNDDDDDSDREQKKGFYKKPQQSFEDDHIQLYAQMQIQKSDQAIDEDQTDASTQRPTYNEEIGSNRLQNGNANVSDQPETEENKEEENQHISSHGTSESDDNTQDQQIDNGSQNNSDDTRPNAETFDLANTIKDAANHQEDTSSIENYVTNVN